MASFIHSFIKKLLTSETDADGDAGEQEVELVAPPAAVLLLLVGGFEDVDDVGRLDERRRVDDVTRRRRLDDPDVPRIGGRRRRRLGRELKWKSRV